MDANLLDLLVGAARPVETVLARIDRSDDGRPTPCPEMSVAQVAAHLIGGMQAFATVAEGGELHFDAVLDPSFEEDRPAELFRAALDELCRAFGVAGRLEQSFAMPWGETAGAQLVGFELIEVLAHGWDIARAVGVALVVDDDVVTAVLDGARAGPTTRCGCPACSAPRSPSATRHRWTRWSRSSAAIPHGDPPASERSTVRMPGAR